MTQHIYTKEEVEDVKKRELDAIAYLKEKQLNPTAQVSLVNQGDDTFVIKVQPYLGDLKFLEVLSPIQDIKKDEPTQTNL